jgi:hypothetical protein
MDVLEAGPGQTASVRRCHVWCWAPASHPPEWKNRTFVVGGFSAFGAIAAVVSAGLSAIGNQSRRSAAIRAAEPSWRYVTTGSGRLVNGRLVVTDSFGNLLTFDPGSVTSLDQPAPGWIRLRMTDSPVPWAIQIV